MGLKTGKLLQIISKANAFQRTGVSSFQGTKNKPQNLKGEVPPVKLREPKIHTNNVVTRRDGTLLGRLVVLKTSGK